MIVETAMIDDHFYLMLDNNVLVDIFDAGQSCCEQRHMKCDDDITGVVGQHLRGIVEKPTDADGETYGVHEILFVEILTDEGGCLSLVNHNEHNGYYGGFTLSVEARDLDALSMLLIRGQTSSD